MNMDLSNYGWGLPVQASTYAARIDNSLFILHVAMIVIFVVWAVYMVYCMVRYRQSANPKALYSKELTLASYTPDLVIFVFEIWLIFFVGIPIWAYIREKLPAPENAVEISLSAEQFAWVFHYPGQDRTFGKRETALVHANNPLGIDYTDPHSTDDIVSINELYIPLGKPVRLYLTSKDVIHSFFVPEFRTKQDVVPGMKIPIWFEPTRTGHFEIACSQLCGSGHYRMRGDLYVVTPEEYEKWQAQMRSEQDLLKPKISAAADSWK